MYKNDFDSAFDAAYGDYVFESFIRGYRRYLCVKWTLFVVVFAAVALIVFLFNGNELAFKIGFIVVFGVILLPLYLAFYPKYGKGGRSENALNALLLNVLRACFDEEIGISEIELNKADYEQSCPEQRYRNFETMSFTADDVGIVVKTPRAEITISGAVAYEANTAPSSEIYNDTLTTGMIFAVARFVDSSSLQPDNERVKAFIAERAEKIYVSAYENTLYIEIDYKDISVKGMSKKRLRNSCFNICENVSIILETVDRI